MPHKFQIIKCKKCDKSYCLCEAICPKCNEPNITDNDTKIITTSIEHMNKQERAELERKVLNYKIEYMKYNVNKDKFPLVMSLPPEIVVKLTNDIGKEHPKMHITKILGILEKKLNDK